MDVKFCPYCGNRLMEGDQICSQCGSEISFVDSGAIDNDNYEDLKIEHEGLKLGKRTFVISVIATILCFFLPLFFMTTDLPNHLSVYIFVQFVVYFSVAAEAGIIGYSFFNNRRCKRHGYNTIGYFKASLWISLFGFSFGVLFCLIVLIKLITGDNPNNSSTVIGELKELLPYFRSVLKI